MKVWECSIGFFWVGGGTVECFRLASCDYSHKQPNLCHTWVTRLPWTVTGAHTAAIFHCSTLRHICCVQWCSNCVQHLHVSRLNWSDALLFDLPSITLSTCKKKWRKREKKSCNIWFEKIKMNRVSITCHVVLHSEMCICRFLEGAFGFRSSSES